MTKNTERQDGEKLIYEIICSSTIQEVGAKVSVFLDYIETNRKYKLALCRSLLESITRYAYPYLMRPLFSDKNVNIIPATHSVIFLLSTCLPLTTDANVIINGLQLFLERSAQYIDPIHEIITVQEIDAVLGAAQRKFKLLDVIAPQKPLKIIRLNNSHIVHNCECGIAKDEAVIMVYHPRDVSKCDRVFIFAHEVGHALHMALTKDIDILPDAFEEFNMRAGVEHPTLKDKQEAFADVAGLTILNCDELRIHVPTIFSEALQEVFEIVITKCIDRYLNS